MDENEFNMCLLGAPVYVKATMEKMRYRVSEAIDIRARERRQEGRPDIAGRLTWLASQVRVGRLPTKRVLNKLRKDIEVVESRLINDVPEAIYPIG